MRSVLFRSEEDRDCSFDNWYLCSQYCGYHDLSSLPPGLVHHDAELLLGAARVFQLHYRDPNGAFGTGFNISDAIRIRFLP